MDVVLVVWPTEAGKRKLLAENGAARLLLVGEGHDPPETEDCLEDWIRVPASDTDVRARIRGLASRHRSHTDAPPEIDDDGVLRFRGQWVSVPPIEARLARALLARFSLLVSRDALARAGWPEGSPGRNALDVHVLRLRRRLAPLGLAIRTVRCRGYLLEASDDCQRGVREA